METEQFHAGYLLDSVKEDLTKFSVNKVSGLLKNICVFDFESNINFQHKESPIYPYYCVLNNILTRGIPTKASVFIEQHFEKLYKNQTLDTSLINKQLGNIKFKSTVPENEKVDLFEALHIIDPRIKFTEENYNTNILGSSFEKDFLFKYIKSEGMPFLANLFLPQRQVDTIVPKERAKDFPKQQVDFAIESPYLNAYSYQKFGSKKIGYKKNIGSVVEIDGKSYHSSLSQRILDESRDDSINLSDWETIRFESLPQDKILHWFNTADPILSTYINEIGKNYSKSLDNEKWRDSLETALVPFGIARLQKVIIELLLSGFLDLEKKEWNIAVIERDLPCANLAIDDLNNWVNHLFKLSNDKQISKLQLPKVNLKVFSTTEFKQSKLHNLKNNVNFDSAPLEAGHDLIIDIAILTKSNLEKPVNYPGNFVKIRSSHYTHSHRNIYTSGSIKYKQVTKRGDNEVYNTNKEIETYLSFFLQNIFRKEGFRIGQLPIINRAIQGKSVIGLLPTGGGKSLIYQLASMLQPGVVMVIDPIKSLMQDQYDSLIRNGIDCCNYINSKLDSFEKKVAVGDLINGNVLFTFISPERLQIESFRETLEEMFINSIYFSYCVIDEVHCVSEWGHDFRTSYLSLGRNALSFCKTKGYPNKLIPLFGLTATASFDVLSDVERELSGNGKTELDTEAVVRFENTNRNELQYKIVEVEVEFEKKQIFTKRIPSGELFTFSATPLKNGVKNKVAEEKQKKIVDLLNEIPEYIENFNERSEELVMLAKSRVFEDSQFVPSDIKIHDFNKGQFYNYKAEYDEKKYQNGGIVFTPHRTWLQGVTDRFKDDKYDQDEYDDGGNIIHQRGDFILDENGQKIRVPLHRAKGIADIIERSKSESSVGVFMGSSDEDEKTGKEVEAASFTNQYKFINNEQNIMVATKAFGMGIDKPNVRFTIHYNFPSSIESFVQEAGRAGRDKKIALSTIVFNHQKTYYFNTNFYRKIKGKIHESEFKILEVFREEHFVEEDLIVVLNEAGLNGYFDKEVFKENIGVINVDKDNLKYFHDNSFKGKEKEKVIIYEILTKISLPDSKQISSLVEKLEDATGLESVYISENKNWLNIYSNRETVGSINLTSFYKSFRFTIIDRTRAEEALNNIIKLIKASFPNWHDNNLLVSWLNQSVSNETEPGIEVRLDEIDEGEFINPPIEIHFNNKNADKTSYLESLTAALKNHLNSDISEADVKDCICSNYNEFLENLNEKRPNMGLSKLGDEIKNKAKVAFYSQRVKADTDKALFRLMSIGVIDDYTIDYNKKTYTLHITKKKEGEYITELYEYIKRYYSENRALQEKLAVEKQKGKTEIQKCLGYLTDFIYKEIETKRVRATDDMIFACRESLRADETENGDGNEELKDFIFMYFNSKYAKDKYEIDGENFSLNKDTNDGKDFGFNIVWKYIDVIKKDKGSEKNNVKHLRGACLRLLRTQQNNGALLLLKSFSLFVLGYGDNKVLFNETRDSFIDGFKAFKNQYPEKDLVSFLEHVEKFKRMTLHYANRKAEVTKVIDEFTNLLIIEFHKDWLKSFNNKYLDGYDR
jgi:superfamily II DNA helicase RecQ